jgi:hypothetical protein
VAEIPTKEESAIESQNWEDEEDTILELGSNDKVSRRQERRCVVILMTLIRPQTATGIVRPSSANSRKNRRDFGTVNSTQKKVI